MCGGGGGGGGGVNDIHCVVVPNITLNKPTNQPHVIQLCAFLKVRYADGCNSYYQQSVKLNCVIGSLVFEDYMYILH